MTCTSIRVMARHSRTWWRPSSRPGSYPWSPPPRRCRSKGPADPRRRARPARRRGPRGDRVASGRPAGQPGSAVPLDGEEAGRLAGRGQGGAAAVVLGPQHGPGQGLALTDARLPTPQQDPVVLVVEIRDRRARTAPADEAEAV